MTTSRSELKKQDILDELRFVREWIGNPLKTGAVSPSGRWLARAMAAEVDVAREGVVVELGPGTGVFTRALLDRGIPAERLLLIEYNRDFCRLLAERFPGVKVIQGDAYAIRSHLDALDVGPVASVVTGLPLLSRSLRRRVELVEACLDAGRPGMPLIQFTYAFQPPVPAGEGDYDVRLAHRVLFNLPPATVWVYSRG